MTAAAYPNQRDEEQNTKSWTCWSQETTTGALPGTESHRCPAVDGSDINCSGRAGPELSDDSTNQLQKINRQI